MNKGLTPEELAAKMASKGVMGNANVVEKIVHVEDKEKMAELEAKIE